MAVKAANEKFLSSSNFFMIYMHHMNRTCEWYNLLSSRFFGLSKPVIRNSNFLILFFLKYLSLFNLMSGFGFSTTPYVFHSSTKFFSKNFIYSLIAEKLVNGKNKNCVELAILSPSKFTPGNFKFLKVVQNESP